MSSPRWNRTTILPPIVALIGLYQFTTSFFLAKHSLPHISTCHENSAAHLLQESLGLTLAETQLLIHRDILSSSKSNPDPNASGSIRQGCWMNRRVDAIAVIVIDALRFDFALEHLPNSIGSRLTSPNKHVGHSQLFQFVADPPTVTMQRLKGLTTGGLPTFADISGSFGGASVDEDSWVDQIKYVNHTQRYSVHQKQPGMIAFVGDDTWIDLYPTQFDDSHPYPSFNTRDLDTVDDGCLLHMPRLLRAMGDLYEVIVIHFLGVDHVGHTYGPNNPHMEAKLHQMDVALSQILEKVDTSTSSCQSVFVFGDHGMTEDGNHGGGTSDEMNAALFSHYSPGCGDMKTNPILMNQKSDSVRKVIRKSNPIPQSDNDDVLDSGVLIEEAFQSIHQIDLVPTISFLLGLPIPFANLGGLVPALLPPSLTSFSSNGDKNEPKNIEAPMTATALALNVAQVWNYLTSYSKHSNTLPKKDMQELEQLLKDATTAYKSAISSLSSENENERNDIDVDDNISSEFHDASGLFKLFLSQATEMGKRVWTRFDTFGMGTGILILFMAVVLAFPSTYTCLQFIQYILKHPLQLWRVSIPIMDQVINGIALIFVVFHCIMLTFSNSYIETEQNIVMYMMAVLCIFLALRSYILNQKNDISNSKLHQTSSSQTKNTSHIETSGLLLFLPFAGRLNELFATGHGLDPSLHVHLAHSPFIFFICILLMGYLRHVFFSHLPMSKAFDTSNFINIESFTQKISFLESLNHICDYLTLICLFFSWIEKYSQDETRNGYTLAFIALLLPFMGSCVISCVFYFWPRHLGQTLQKEDGSEKGSLFSSKQDRVFHRSAVITFKILLFIVTVTGPSSSMTSVLFMIQVLIFYKVMNLEASGQISYPIMAALWRFITRHTFFATGHACSFNRLQFSAAFVASSVFHFVPAGISLFLNTFGWEVLGSITILIVSYTSNKWRVMEWYFFYQLLEAFSACVSVSHMRRHLMVWAIFAPRFVFGCIFFGITSVLFLLITFLIRDDNKVTKGKNK